MFLFVSKSNLKVTPFFNSIWSCYGPVFLSCLLFLTGIYAQVIRYLDAGISPGIAHEGTTWAKAYSTVREPLKVANVIAGTDKFCGREGQIGKNGDRKIESFLSTF